MTRRQVLVSVAAAAVVAVAAFGLASGVAPTSAAWTDSEYTKAVSTGVTPVAPTALACQGAGLLASAVPFTWTAPTGPAPSGYTLKWTGITSGSASFPTASGSVTSPIGAITVRVYADYGSWQSTAGIQTRQIVGVAFVGWTCG